jgi:hypothetical protein
VRLISNKVDTTAEMRARRSHRIGLTIDGFME